jgi:hypothetical protein
LKTKLWGMLTLMLCLNWTQSYGMDPSVEMEPSNGINEMERACPTGFLLRSAEIKRLPDPYYQVQAELIFGDDVDNSFAIPSFKAGNKNYTFIPNIYFRTDGCGNVLLSYKLDSSNKPIFSTSADKVKIKYSLMQKIKNLNLDGEKNDIFSPLLRQASNGDSFKMIIEFVPFLAINSYAGEAVLRSDVCIDFIKIVDYPIGAYL